MSVHASGPLAKALNEATAGAFLYRVIAICFLIAMLDGFDTQSIAFVAPALKSLWQVPPKTLGILFAASLFGTMLGAVSFGALADRLGRKNIILASLLTFGVMSLLSASATATDQLMLYRFITGLGLGGAIPNIIALTSEYAPLRVRTTAVTIMFCGFPLGAILGGMASAHILQSHGWPMVFVIGGLPPILLLPIVKIWLPESVRYLALKQQAAGKILAIMQKIDPRFSLPDTELPAPEEAAPKSSPIPKSNHLKDLFTEGRGTWTLLLWLVMSMSLLLTYFLVNWIPSTLADAGLSHHDAVMGAVVLNIGGILGSIIVGRLSDRCGPFIPLIGGYAIGAAAIAAIGINAKNIPHVMIVIFLAGFFLLGAQLALAALTARYYPTYMRSTGVGWSMGVGRVGSALGPVIGGALLAYGLTVTSLYLAAALPAIIAALALTGMSANVPAMPKEMPDEP